jgi:hypothetical protein
VTWAGWLQFGQSVLMLVAVVLLWGLRKAYDTGRDDQRVLARLEALEREVEPIKTLPDELRQEFDATYMSEAVSSERWKHNDAEHEQIRNELATIRNRCDAVLSTTHRRPIP